MRRTRRPSRSARRPFLALVLPLVLTLACAAGLAVAPGAATAAPARPRTWVNLIANPGAQAGAASVQGWDSVTIPGWQTGQGLPTVVRYGTRGFPAISGRPPAVRGGQLFAGGVGGTAVLWQDIRLRGPGGQVAASGYQVRAVGLARRQPGQPGQPVRRLPVGGRPGARPVRTPPRRPDRHAAAPRAGVPYRWRDAAPRHRACPPDAPPGVGAEGSGRPARPADRL